MYLDKELVLISLLVLITGDQWPDGPLVLGMCPQDTARPRGEGPAVEVGAVEVDPGAAKVFL